MLAHSFATAFRSRKQRSRGNRLDLAGLAAQNHSIQPVGLRKSGQYFHNVMTNS
jgi:hypothetical protein